MHGRHAQSEQNSGQPEVPVRIGRRCANQSGAVAPHSKSCEARAVESRVARSFGVRCEAPLWFANVPCERLILGASRPLLRTRTKAALSRRTPKAARRRRWSRAWLAVLAPGECFSARSRPAKHPQSTKHPRMRKALGASQSARGCAELWSAVRSSCADQSGAVAPHSKSCEARAVESRVARSFGVRCEAPLWFADENGERSNGWVSVEWSGVKGEK